jgi:hypothetical protein
MNLTLELILKGEVDVSFLKESSLELALADFLKEKDFSNRIINMSHQIHQIRKGENVKSNNFKTFEELRVKSLNLKYPRLEVVAELTNSPVNKVVLEKLNSYAFNLGLRGWKRDRYIIVNKISGLGLIHHLDERITGHINLIEENEECTRRAT